MRTEESAAVGFQIVAVAQESEFDGEPEESRHRADHAGELLCLFLRILYAPGDSGGGMCAVAEANEGIGEVRVGMHRDVSGDVVKDVRFRQVIQLVMVPDGDGGGKLPVP